MTPILIALAVLALASAAGAWWLYNRLVAQRNAVDAAWAQIDVQLRRRTDLIPNLVALVRAYASHERATFEAVTAARTRAVHATHADRSAAEASVGRAMQRLLAVAEAYPTLQAHLSFLALRDDLLGTEARIAFARHYYNEQVLTYANRRQTLPSKLVARLFAFPPRPYFELPDATMSGPAPVSFGDAPSTPA